MKKLYKNLGASVLPQIMNIITNLILPSLIISKFGSDTNGLVSTTRVIIAYISIIGAGIASSVTQALYKPVAQDDYQTVKGMLHSATIMFNKFGYLYCFVTLLISFVYPLFIKSDISYLSISMLLIVMSISGASEFFVIGRYRSLLYAYQRVYVSTIIQAISLLLSLLLAIIMLRMDANIIIVQLSISIVYVLRALFLAIYIKKEFPQFTNFKDVKPINSATEKKNDALIHQVAGLAVGSSQTAILAIFVNLEAASIYSVYNIVFSGLQSICSNLSISISPFLGRELALNKRENLQKYYNFVEFGFFTLVSFIYSVSIIMIIPFIKIYTKNADINYVNYLFAFIFAFSSAFYILKLPSASLINVAGHFKETKFKAIIEAVLSIVLSLIFTFLIGLNGVVLGTGIALLWRCFDTITYVNKCILDVKNYQSIKRLLITFLTLIFSTYISRLIYFNSNNFYDWIKQSIIVSIITMLIIFIIVFITDNKTVINIIQTYKSSKNMEDL